MNWALENRPIAVPFISAGAVRATDAGMIASRKLKAPKNSTSITNAIG